MSKWRKRIPILVMTLSVLALCVVALSFATTEDQKEDYVQQVNAIRSTSQAEVLHPDVVAKLEMEAEIQAKLEAEAEAELPTANRPAVQEDLKVNPFKTQPTMPAYTPRGEILWEGFESGTVPPPNWTAVVTNAYTWEIDSYNPYEGTYNASCYYDADYTGTQDEWLVSPVIDLTGKTDWKLEFVWMGSYYWGVDPYDNYDLEVWISTDGGSTWPTMLWTEPGTEAPWSNWTWYEATVDLSGYSTESNVKIGFRYSGYDGAQWSIDAISVNDEAQPIGRCCYGDPTSPSCLDVTELECEELGGYSWDQGLNCEDNPCPLAPENDECVNAELIPPPFPATASGTTEGATIDCPGVLDWNAVWYKFDAPYQCNDVSIDYCGGPYEIMTIGVVLYPNCDDCGNYILYSSIEWLDCEGLTQPKVYWDNLPGPATYYIPVFLGDGVESPFQLTLDVIECPPPEPGDNCSNPIEVDNPTMRWSDLNQTTCGRGDNYDGTCLGSYDGGEDIIYEVIVSSAVTVNITLDPKGTSWTGVAIGTDCPPTDCLALSTNSGGDPHGMKCVDLDPGVYYIMVDTWPSPDCIPDFDLHITDTTCEALENDDCANATAVGEVVDLAFSTETATFDGGGTCLYSPNIWYCYTATETGDATISLCGSEYDTKMAVYDGCTCDPLGTELACNDDACGLQSEAVIPVTAGNSYLVEVGGYSTNTGDGILNISVGEPCDIVCVGTPEGEPCIGDDEEDVTNGGCNSVPPVWGTIDCDETVCGEWNTYLYGGSNYRDTDWYKFTLTQCSDVTITAVGEFPIVFGFLEQVIDGGGWDCSNFTGYISPYATGDECDTVVVQRLAMAAGDYAIFVGGQVFSGFGCALGTFEYSVSVDCVPAVPTYCEASGGCDEYIENVTFETINNTTGCDNYGDYTALSATVEAGNSYPITITIANGYSSDTGAVYVDWNQDLDFYDPGELQFLSPGAGAGPTYSGTVTVPGDALPGETRMRIRLSWNTDPVPCGTQSYGEVEDYTINVSGEDEFWWKEPNGIYMPDFDQYQMPCGCWCGPTAAANCLWWFHLQFPDLGVVPPGMTPPDLIDTLGDLMHVACTVGVYMDSLQDGIDEWLVMQGIRNRFSEITVWEPTYDYCREQLMLCQDVILLMGYWHCVAIIPLGGDCWEIHWTREGGHFVTMAGVDPVGQAIGISDPAADGALQGQPGRVLGPNHNPPEGHNDGVSVSHDIYDVSTLGISPGGSWEVLDYVSKSNFDLESYKGINPNPHFARGDTIVTVWCGDLPDWLQDSTIVTEVEAAAVVCPVDITYLFEPDPVLVLYKFTIDRDPMPGYIYLSSEAVGGDVNDLSNLELKVGDCVVPITATEIITGGYGGLEGDAMKLTFGIKEYIECEEGGSLIFGEIESFFDVYYDMAGTPSQMTGQVTMIGHATGDLNLDGSVNVADVTYFVEWLFTGGPAPVILELADVDGSGGNPNVADLIYLVDYIFNAGPPPIHQ